eukprot:3590154-Prymnesium_polylepis.1
MLMLRPVRQVQAGRSGPQKLALFLQKPNVAHAQGHAALQRECTLWRHALRRHCWCHKGEVSERRLAGAAAAVPQVELRMPRGEAAPEQHPAAGRRALPPPRAAAGRDAHLRQGGQRGEGRGRAVIARRA